MNNVDYTLHDAGLKAPTNEFALIHKSERWYDGLFLFLQNIFHLYPEEKYHWLIVQELRKGKNDSEIYSSVLTRLNQIRPKLQPLTYALPALKVQKNELIRQTLELLGTRRTIQGYLEIGSPGRYISRLRQEILLQGDVALLHDSEPSFSLADIFERGGLFRFARYVPIDDFDPIDEKAVASESLDLVTCYIGLHHIRLHKLDAFVASIRRVLRKGGRFVLRDHDAEHQEMHTFASLVHTVFNAGLGVSWETNSREIRNFRGLKFWQELLQRHGMTGGDKVIFQDNDPSLNGLMIFEKQ